MINPGRRCLGHNIRAQTSSVYINSFVVLFSSSVSIQLNNRKMQHRRSPTAASLVLMSTVLIMLVRYDYTSIYIAWRTLLYTYHIDYSFVHRAPVCINNFITNIILQFVFMYMSSLRPFLKNHRFRPPVPFAFFRQNVPLLIS